MMSKSKTELSPCRTDLVYLSKNMESVKEMKLASASFQMNVIKLTNLPCGFGSQCCYERTQVSAQPNCVPCGKCQKVVDTPYTNPNLFDRV